MIRILLTATAAVLLAASASDPAVCQTGTQPYSATVFGHRTVTQDWTYTLENTSEDANYTVWLLQIEVDEQTEVLSASRSTGWAVDISVPHFVTWIATSSELMKGESNSGFGVTYCVCPQYQNWSAMFNNIGDPSECPSDGGSIRMAETPEPSALAALLVGLAAVFRPRRKSHA